MLFVLGQGASGCTPLTPWSQRSSCGARQQAETLADRRPDLQQRNQDRGEDWPKKDAHDAEPLNAAEDGVGFPIVST
jgi:hypothetical protein